MRQTPTPLLELALSIACEAVCISAWASTVQAGKVRFGSLAAISGWPGQR